MEMAMLLVIVLVRLIAPSRCRYSTAGSAPPVTVRRQQRTDDGQRRFQPVRVELLAGVDFGDSSAPQRWCIDIGTPFAPEAQNEDLIDVFSLRSQLRVPI